MTAGTDSRTRLARVFLFIAVAIAFSWCQWLAVIASQRHWTNINVRLTALPIFGPLVAIPFVLRSRRELEFWFRSISNWRVSPKLLAASLFGMPAVFGISLSLAAAVKSSTVDVPWPSAATVAMVFVGMLLTAGVGEELGWRGYLLPELRRSLSSVAASGVVAVIWFVWHLPLFWVTGASQQEIPVSTFALGLISYSFILTWLVEAANSSLVAVLFHTSANVVFWLVMVLVKRSPLESRFSPAYVGLIALLGVVAALSLAVRGRIDEQRDQRVA
jgi:uncharacterized protein